VNAYGNRLPGVVAPILGDGVVLSVGNVGWATPEALAEQAPQSAGLMSRDCVCIEIGRLPACLVIMVSVAGRHMGDTLMFDGL
jgi:hypothetical protein